MSESMAKVGHVFKATMDEKKQEFVLKKSCGKNDGGQWFCITHDKGFKTNLNAQFHTSDKKHLMCWFCFEHGFEAV